MNDTTFEICRIEFCIKLDFLLIENWFKHLHNVLTKYNLFNRPEALWNVDEAGFMDDPGRRSGVIKRTTKHAIAAQSAGIYPFDPCAVSNEKMFVPTASTATTSTPTNTKPASSDDSVIDNAPRPRLKRSTSCGHFSNAALNLTRTTLCDKSNDHMSSSISTSLSSSLIETNTSCALTDDSNFVNQMATSSIYTLSGNADITTTIDPSTKAYNELNHQLSYQPVLIDLTNNVPFPSSRTQSMYQTTPISLPQGMLISPASQNLETL
ncbi:unnamed protein product, partial [Rotaria socialis]